MGHPHCKVKEKIRKEYSRRVRSILRNELNRRNKIKATIVLQSQLRNIVLASLTGKSKN